MACNACLHGMGSIPTIYIYYILFYRHSLWDFCSSKLYLFVCLSVCLSVCVFSFYGLNHKSWLLWVEFWWNLVEMLELRSDHNCDTSHRNFVKNKIQYNGDFQPKSKLFGVKVKNCHIILFLMIKKTFDVCIFGLFYLFCSFRKVCDWYDMALIFRQMT